MGCRSDELSSAWSRNLHSNFIISPNETTPDPGCLPGPSNEVLSSLSTNLNMMAMNWERHLTSSRDTQKKCKFDSLEPFLKQMILNASSVSGAASAVDPSPHVKSLMNCSSIARAQITLNHLLQKQNVHIEVPLSFVTAIINGDWTSRGSSGPGKMSFLLLGTSVSDYKSSSAEKASLTLQL